MRKKVKERSRSELEQSANNPTQRASSTPAIDL